MLPSIWPGDVITISQQAVDEFAIGEVGLFRTEGRLLAHRIRSIVTIHDSLHFITRGDSVPDNDPPFHHMQLLGKVAAIQRNGETRSPARPFSLYGRVVGWILCHCDRLRSLSLHFHALSGSGTREEFDRKNLPWNSVVFRRTK